MNPDLLVAGVLVALVALALVGLTWLVRDRRRMHAELAAARADARAALADAAELRIQLDRVCSLVDLRPEPTEYVITHLGEEVSTASTGLDGSTGEADPPARIDGKLFADLVLRETVVKAAAFGHGVRRAMAPETRNRIRFEMRREVKRARKARKDEFKQVRREMRDRQRAAEAPA